ncbi:Tn3 family transposase [Microbispora sp. NPDC046933]|uniref:Tn3 family transposase n=1 Tax=Microbispora sp. NPDC046933 TaxID=3155618 RepID=UPI0033EC6E9A
MRAEGHDIKDEDVARLSPLKDRHINVLGRYLFNIRSSGPGHGLRPLRDPTPPRRPAAGKPEAALRVSAWSGRSLFS